MIFLLFKKYRVLDCAHYLQNYYHHLIDFYFEHICEHSIALKEVTIFKVTAPSVNINNFFKVKVKTICAIEIVKIHLVINVIIRVSYYISSNTGIACLISLTHNRQTIFALRSEGGGGKGGWALPYIYSVKTMVFDYKEKATQPDLNFPEVPPEYLQTLTLDCVPRHI